MLPAVVVVGVDAVLLKVALVVAGAVAAAAPVSPLRFGRLGLRLENSKQGNGETSDSSLVWLYSKSFMCLISRFTIIWWM